MHPPALYMNLIDEVSQKFPESDWSQIRRWIEREAQAPRPRPEPFVPQTLEALADPADPLLHAGDGVAGPLLARGARFRLPARCHVAGSLFALGAAEIEEGAQVDEDVLAAEEIVWRGGPTSHARTLVAPRVALWAAGTIGGGIWCDALLPGPDGAHLAPGLAVQGVVVVDEPLAGRVVVGAGCQLGGLHVQGAVETEADVTISHLQASGPIVLGRRSRAGVAQGGDLAIGRQARVGAAHSAGTLQAQAGAVLDSARAAGDIALDATALVTGNLLLTEQGQFHIPAGAGWHSRRDHWFTLLPDDTLRPYAGEAQRPAGSALLAIRALTHALWHQAVALAGGHNGTL